VARRQPADGRPVAGPTADQILTEERFLCRYQAALPVDPVHRISLGDGWTPLLPIDWKGQRIQVKPEWYNPTSSFKDRAGSA
jgi:threonine synthase